MLLVLAGVMISSQPDWFAASVILKVDQDAWANLTYEEYHATWDGKSYGGPWIPDTFETICSQAVLLPVITNLNLKVKWAGERQRRGPLDNKETLRLLKERMEVSGQRNLITIRVWSHDSSEAAQIANEISKSAQAGFRLCVAVKRLRIAEGWQAKRASAEEKLASAEMTAQRLRAELHLTKASGPEPAITGELIAHETNPKCREYWIARRDSQIWNSELEMLDAKTNQVLADETRPRIIEVLDTAIPSPRPVTRKGVDGGLLFLAGLAMIGVGYWRGMQSETIAQPD